jgi:hypothetical protein
VTPYRFIQSHRREERPPRRPQADDAGARSAAVPHDILEFLARKSASVRSRLSLGRCRWIFGFRRVPEGRDVHGSAVDPRLIRIETEGGNQLLSPPWLPEYNGACEAAIGWMKSRTRWIAAQDARVGSWTSDDLEAARILAKETPRVRVRGGKTPDELSEVSPAHHSYSP